MHGISVSRVISRAQMLSGAAAAGLASMLLACCLPIAMAAVPADPLYCQGGQALRPPGRNLI